jgi:predicted permease
MSLLSKAFYSGIGRTFSLPRLSVPLIATLGLTLGAVLTVIAITSSLLFQPLQGVTNESKIKTVDYRLVMSEQLNVSYWDFRRLAGIEEAFGDLGTWAAINVAEQTISIDEISFSSTRFTASNTILDVLGTKLLLGDDVNVPDPEKYVWLSNSLWQSAFSGDRSVLGKQIKVNDQQLIVAGIIEDLMAVDSSQPVLPQQVWQIINLKKLYKDPETTNITNSLESLLLKTHNSSTLAPNKEEIDQWLTTFITENTASEAAPLYLKFIQSTKTTHEIGSYRDAILGDTATLITALFFAVLGLLLMATLNLLNLFIAHYQGRTKEFAIQLSLGASLSKVRLMVMLENLPSFILAAITGLLVAGWGVKSLPLIAGNNLPMIETISIDTTVIIAALITIFILNALFSALALVDIDKHALTNNLNSSGKGVQAQSNQYISRGLMIFQLAIASILLSASVMLAIQSYQSVYRDLGYSYDDLFQVSVNIEDDVWVEKLTTYEKYADSEIKGLHDNVSRYIEEQISGSEVIIAGQGALSNSMSMSMFMPEDNPDGQFMFQSRTVTPKFFDAFGIKFLAGSNITAQQIAQSEPRVVIDINMATKLFPELSLNEILGKSVLLSNGEDAEPVIITGIVPETQSRAGNTTAMVMPAIYSPDLGASNQLNFIVKSSNIDNINSDKFITEFNNKFPRFSNIEIISLEDIWQRQTLNQRVSLWIVIAMTALTILLAAIGVAGLTQMTTNHRKYELAVRMATGAKQSRLVKFILKDAFWMLFIGLGLGFTLSVFGYEQLQNNLTMLPDFNGVAMSILDLGLIFIVLLSVIIPAWRVISSDPMQALRED